MSNKNKIVLLILILNFINLILCDKPLINYIEPLTINDKKISIYGRFFGNKVEDVKLELDGKFVNISEWSSSSLIIDVLPPNPKVSKIKVTTPLGVSIQHTIEYMNPLCLGIDVCNGHGICIENSTKCLCNEPWSGLDCSTITGESMIELQNIPTIHTSTKLNIFTIPNQFEFKTTVGLVLKEHSINGLQLNSYLLTPSAQFGSIKGPGYQVYRYRTNTLVSSSDRSFNCDITLTHYESNQTKSIYNKYINEIKDSFALGVIINNFIPISNTNKLTLYIYPMIKSKKLYGGKLNTIISKTSTTNNSNSSSNSIDKSFTNGGSDSNDDGQYVNGTTTIKMSIGTQKLRVNLYNFGLFSTKFTDFETNVLETLNSTNYKNPGGYNSTTINNGTFIDNDIYSIISISSNSSKYLYFNADFYPSLDVDNNEKLTLFNDEKTNSNDKTNGVVGNNNKYNKNSGSSGADGGGGVTVNNHNNNNNNNKNSGSTGANGDNNTRNIIDKNNSASSGSGGGTGSGDIDSINGDGDSSNHNTVLTSHTNDGEGTIDGINNHSNSSSSIYKYKYNLLLQFSIIIVIMIFKLM